MTEWLKSFASDDLGKTIVGAALALIAVAFGAFLNGLKDLFVESAKRKRLAWLTAMRLTVILDRYVDECATHAADDGEYNNEGNLNLRYPEPDLVYPEDLAWTSLKKQIMYGAFSLQVRHDGTISTLNFTAREIALDPDRTEYFAEKGEMISRRGLDALELIRKIKKKYRVPTAERGEFNPRAIFKREIASYETRVAEREARRQEVPGFILTPPPAGFEPVK